MQIANLCIGIYNGCILLIQSVFFLRSSNTNTKSNSGKAFLALSLCTLVLVLGSIISVVPDESTGSAYAGYFLYLFGIFAHLFVFNIYLQKELYKTIWQLRFLYPAFCCLLCFTLGFISIFNNCVFSIDSELTLNPGKLYYLVYAIALVLYIYDVILALLKRKQLSKELKNLFIIFPTIICVGITAAIVFPQLLLISCACLFSITLFFRTVLQRKFNNDIEEHGREIKAVAGSSACIYHWDYEAKKFYSAITLPEYAFEMENGYLIIDKLIEGGIAEPFREGAKQFFDNVVPALLASDKKESREFEFRDGVYSEQWRRLSIFRNPNENGVLGDVYLTFRDISYEKALYNKNQAQRRRFNAAVVGIYSQIAEVDVEHDKGVVLSFEGQIVEEKPMDTSWTAHLNYLFENKIHEESRDSVALFYPEALLKSGKESFSCAYRFKQDNQEYVWFSTTVRYFVDENGKKILLYLTQDINDKISEHNKLKDASEHDFLTDLFNRTKYEAMLKDEYSHLNSCGVLFFDINKLKQTNDKSGHSAGDALISLAAESVRSITNRRIHAYRYGGDEMVVVLCNYPRKKLDEVLDFWRTRLEKLNRNSGMQCTMAVGKAWAEGDFSVKELVARADASMYENKRQNRKTGDKA